MSNPILSCSGLKKSYQEIENSDNHKLTVLSGLDFTLYPGEQVAIIGRSGSGKSTLLNLLGGLDTPTAGYVKFKQYNWAELNESKRAELRNRHLGFVYQFHHLLAEFTAIENVAMPLLMRQDLSMDQVHRRAEYWLRQVGLGERFHHRPGMLSGGERQRVAIARALVTEPEVVLADEPTGNLDYDTAQQIFALIKRLNTDLKTTFLIVTHDRELAGTMDRQYELLRGNLQ